MALHIEQIPDDSPLYVRNKADGDFLLTLYSKQGSPESVPLPRTWIPILATSFAPTSLFKESTDFRKALGKGIIEIIDQKEAEEILKRPEAIQELERLRRDVFSAFTTESSPVSSYEAMEAIAKEEINERVVDTMLRDDLGVDDKMSMLINEAERGGLKKEDFEYIIAQATDKKISNWATKMLESVNAKKIF